MFATVLEPSVDPQATPEKRLEDMTRLGELCIDVLQQNEEHHSEVFWFGPGLKSLLLFDACKDNGLLDI